MTDRKLTKVELSDCTLSALVRLLKLKGFDLDDIFAAYESEILGNLLSGAPPQHKLATIKHLENIINEAKKDELLKK